MNLINSLIKAQQVHDDLHTECRIIPVTIHFGKLLVQTMEIVIKFHFKDKAITLN